MSHQLTVWRAAQLLGITRAVLQEQVRSGELALNDGLLSSDELLRLYPHVQFEESGMLERVVQIKAESFGKRIRERLLPSQEVLAQRVFAQSQELADVRKLLRQYHELVITLQNNVKEMVSQNPGNESISLLENQISQGLGKVLATEPVNVLEIMDDMLKVMTCHVTVRPSGHEFSVDGHSTILEAGLQSGLKLIYGCGNGSCGMCKVRVVSGEVVKTQHYDYQLSEAEKAQGYTLMCCHTPVSSELSIEVLEVKGPQDIPEQLIVGQVRKIQEISPNIRLLHLQTPRTHRFRFLAGQATTLSLDIPGAGSIHASYSMGSCPCDDRNLLFYIETSAGDTFAQHLFAGDITAGTQISIVGPTGDFVLAESNRPLVFAACNNGFAPIKSLIEYAFSLNAAPSISLFWLATEEGGHYLNNQCRAWSEALDQFEYDLITDADTVAGARQIAQTMRHDLFDINCDFYLTGPEEFIKTLSQELHDIGVPALQIHSLIV